MPSFDILSEFKKHELLNAIDQSNREVSTRFDFKNSGAQYQWEKEEISLQATTIFQLEQMIDILKNKCIKREVDLSYLDIQPPSEQHNSATQTIKLIKGIDTKTAKKIINFIKSQKLKVQAAIQGEHIRVNGKKIDDLQSTIQMLKKEDFGLPLEFENFRN